MKFLQTFGLGVCLVLGWKNSVYAALAINAPNNLSVSGVTGTSVTLNWKDNSNNENGFYIYRSTKETSGFSKVSTVSVNVLSMTDSGLTPSKVYYYRVRAFSGSSTSGYSNTLYTRSGNNNPVASNATVLTDRDMAKSFVLSAVDADKDPLTYSVESAPTHGVLTGTAPNLLYTPAAGFYGSDTLTFKAKDWVGTSNLATISITVKEKPNTAPVANASKSKINIRSSSTTSLMLSASDSENDVLNYNIITPPQNGQISGVLPQATYTPNPGFIGHDSFIFVANDGQASSNQAKVDIYVSDAGYMGMNLPEGFRAFAENSPRNVAIPEDPDIDFINSDEMISKLVSVNPKPGLTFSNKSWTFPIHVIDSEMTPLVDVYTPNEVLSPDLDPDQDKIVKGLPIPDRAFADSQTDGHMILIDPVLGKSWEFSKFKKPGETGNISPGLQTSMIAIWDLKGSESREPFIGDSQGYGYWQFGVVGAGMPVAGGVVLLDEVKAGKIEHALLMSGPSNRAGELCRPAGRTDGPAANIGEVFIPEGSRMQLDPNFNSNGAIVFSPQAQTIITALKKYGTYVSDNCPELKIYLQNFGTDGGAWNEIVPGTSRSYSQAVGEISKIPISAFRVLSCDVVQRSSSFFSYSVTDITTNSATINWTTTAPTRSFVEYGTKYPGDKQTPQETDLSTNHTATITGLSPLTTYRIRLRAYDEFGKEWVYSYPSTKFVTK